MFSCSTKGNFFAIFDMLMKNMSVSSKTGKVTFVHLSSYFRFLRMVSSFSMFTISLTVSLIPCAWNELSSLFSHAVGCKSSSLSLHMYNRSAVSGFELSISFRTSLSYTEVSTILLRVFRLVTNGTRNDICDSNFHGGRFLIK